MTMSESEWGRCECGREMTGFMTLYCIVCDCHDGVVQRIGEDSSYNNVHTLYGPDPSHYSNTIPGSRVSGYIFRSTLKAGREWMDKTFRGYNCWKYTFEVEEGKLTQFGSIKENVELSGGKLISLEEIKQ